jgi:hypothetical protein
MPKAGAGFEGSLAVFDRPKTDVGFTDSFVAFAEPNVDVGLAGSAPGAFVFPNENGEPLGVVVVGEVNDREAGCAAVAVKPLIRPNDEPPLSELCAGFSGSDFFWSDCAPPLNGEADALPTWSLPNEKGEVVAALVVAEGTPLVGNPPVGALNPYTGVMVATAAGAPLGAGVVDATVDDPVLGAKKLVIFEPPDGAGTVETGFEGSG